MQLKSNFNDYYDHYFNKEGLIFNRMADNKGPSKREQFRIMEEAGFITPPHGFVYDILDKWWVEEDRWIRDVVAYENEQAHCTEGKRLLNHGHFQHLGSQMTGGPESFRLWNLYCSAFVGNKYAQHKDNPSVSWRRLQIGNEVFWIEYKGFESWMSNYGDGESQVIGRETCESKIELPLYAIDFVLGKDMYAIDFNIAPGIRGSGVEKIFSPLNVYNEIEKWFEDLFRYD